MFNKINLIIIIQSISYNILSTYFSFEFMHFYFLFILEVVFSHQEKFFFLKKYIIQIQFIYIKYKEKK
jgi:hypothetical protein